MQSFNIDSPSRNSPGSVIRLADPFDGVWDRHLGAFKESTTFHTSAWAAVLRDSYNYRTNYLVHERGGETTAALPLMEIKSWLTGRRGVSLPFTDYCSPLYNSTEDLKALIDFAREGGIKRHWKFLEIRGGGQQFWPASNASTQFYGHELDLRRGATQLYKGLNDSIPRALRKSEKAGVTIVTHNDFQAVEAFYQLFCRNRRKLGVPAQPFRFFAAIHRHLLEPGNGFVALARYKETPIAGAVFFKYGKRFIYKFGASDERHLSLRANNLLMWKVIEAAANEGGESLDFGRTSFDNDGLRRYKLSWGAQEKVLSYSRLNLVTGAIVPAPDRSSGWQNKLIQRLPVFAVRIAGELLYKHVG